MVGCRYGGLHFVNQLVDGGLVSFVMRGKAVPHVALARPASLGDGVQIRLRLWRTLTISRTGPNSVLLGRHG